MTETTEYTDDDMAAVGRATMAAIKANANIGWAPADCPSEIVGDLRNERDELAAEIDRLRSALAKIADWGSNWGPFPENNEAWRAMAVVTAREAVPELGPNVGNNRPEGSG